jgi:hypothetical protein
MAGQTDRERFGGEDVKIKQVVSQGREMFALAEDGTLWLLDAELDPKTAKFINWEWNRVPPIPDNRPRPQYRPPSSGDNAI